MAPLWDEAGSASQEGINIFDDSSILRAWERADSHRFRKRAEDILDDVERYIAKGRLLDVGSSTGLQLAVARDRGWNVAGVEICQAAAEFSRHKLEFCDRI